MDLITLDTYRATSILTGILYLLTFITGILSIARAVDHTDYLTKAALHSNQVKKAVLFQFLMAVFYTWIAILLYPLLKTHNETLALGFLGFRIIAALLVVVATGILLKILRLSIKYTKDNSTTIALYKPTGDKLKTARDM